MPSSASRAICSRPSRRQCVFIGHLPSDIFGLPVKCFLADLSPSKVIWKQRLRRISCNLIQGMWRGMMRVDQPNFARGEASMVSTWSSISMACLRSRFFGSSATTGLNRQPYIETPGRTEGPRCRCTWARSAGGHQLANAQRWPSIDSAMTGNPGRCTIGLHHSSAQRFMVRKPERISAPNPRSPMDGQFLRSWPAGDSLPGVAESNDHHADGIVVAVASNLISAPHHADRKHICREGCSSQAHNAIPFFPTWTRPRRGTPCPTQRPLMRENPFSLFGFRFRRGDRWLRETPIMR